MTINICTLVVPDSAVKTLTLTGGYLDLNYKNVSAGDKFVNDLGLKHGFKNLKEHDNGFVILTVTRTDLYAQNKGMNAIILFVTIYLGVIFLLTSAAVLALQQLSEASDSIGRYNSLRKIGVSQSMINKAVFKQTLIYFGAPLSLAIVDSIVGLIFTNKFVSMFGNQNILLPSLLTFALLMIIYIGYFIATFISYKNVIREK